VTPGDASLRFEMPQDKALEAMNRWAGQPLPLVASCWQDGILTLRLAGARAAVDAACARLGGSVVADAEAACVLAGAARTDRGFFPPR
jgi:glycolate oxidase FAD binding subunit